MLDAARLSDGINFRGETMVFSWPSKAGFFDYAYDRESAVWSRDAFERVLASLMATRPPAACTSSPTAWAPCWRSKSLRQLYGALRRHCRGPDRRRGVRLARHRPATCSRPRSQRIGPLAQKITVITATNDRALALSARVAGGVTRVGAAEKAALEKLGLRVVDASGLGWGIINHDLFLSNDEVRRVIRRSVDSGGMAG